MAEQSPSMQWEQTIFTYSSNTLQATKYPSELFQRWKPIPFDDLVHNEAARWTRWGVEPSRGPMSHQDLKNRDLVDIFGLMWSSRGSSLGMQVSDSMAYIVQNLRQRGQTAPNLGWNPAISAELEPSPHSLLNLGCTISRGYFSSNSRLSNSFSIIPVANCLTL